MRVGFNAYFLGQQATGSGQYARHLLQALAEVGNRHEYLLFAPEATGSPPHKRFKFRRLRAPFTGRGEDLAKLWFEQVSFPQACRSASTDVAHVPYCASPFVRPGPTVVTVHDLIPLVLPAYRGSIWVRLYTALVMTAARRADMIITDSEYSKQDILKYLHVSPERIRVIYLAADPSCVPVNAEQELAEMRRKYGLPANYILYLGGFDQRKNVGTLLRAYARLLQSPVKDVPALVVAGALPRRESALFPDPQKLAAQLGVQDQVHFVGWVASEDKPALFSGSVFFVFLSMYEGFGLEPLEAMSCGTPVLVSNKSSLPEIVGDGGVLVDPADLDQVIEGMAALANDAVLRRRLAVEGIERARRFSWSRTADETAKVFELVAGEEQCGAVPSS